MTTVERSESANGRAWIAVGGAIAGAFIALLDMSVTNASLPQIQGEIGATGTEGTWIGTGYLIAETIMIPLTGWFNRLLGIRRFMIGSAVLFAAFSFLCGFSQNLLAMIIGRTGQGFAGGALIPASLTIIATRLTPAQQPLGNAIFAAVAVLAPAVGPLLGGWLTEHVGWPWVFFINVPISGVLVILLMLAIDPEDVRWAELGNADWLGILGLILSLGGTTIILEEGQRENWFESQLMVWLAAAAGVGMVLVLITQFTRAEPILKLKLLLDRGFAGMFAIMVLAGGQMLMFLYIVPIFLGVIAGYSAEETGLVAMYFGVGSFLAVPAAVLLGKHVNVRVIVAVGLALDCAGALGCLDLTPASSGGSFIIAQLLFGAGTLFVMMPMTQAATIGLDRSDVPAGAALNSLARNLGGSLGLALIGVLIDRRSAFHSIQITQASTANSVLLQQRTGELAQAFLQRATDPGHAAQQVLKTMAGEVQRQALTIGFVDCFWVMGMSSVAVIPLVVLLKKHGGALGMAAH